jgi:hypothetical protein
MVVGGWESDGRLFQCGGGGPKAFVAALAGLAEGRAVPVYSRPCVLDA